MAVKVTYFDIGRNTVYMDLYTVNGYSRRSINLTGTDGLKTATLFVNDAVFSANGVNYDIIFKSTGTGAVISFVRVIRL